MRYRFHYAIATYEGEEVERAKVEGKAEIILAKARNGPVGTVHLTFLKQHTRFENAESTRH